jgi:hypothetical protein
MRLIAIGAFAITVLSASLWEPSRVFSGGQIPEKSSVAIYDANPSHIWNRLHSVVFMREDLPDAKLVPDALDPPLWPSTQYLLENPSHERILRILDEFLQTHAERLIMDPAMRAILQRDLWAVFDWSVQQHARSGKPAYEKEKTELQSRLAEVMRRLALTPEEIRSLPSNYALAVASGQFAREYDPDHPDQPFLPPDLFVLRGPWVRIFGMPDTNPVASQHASTFSRSSFLVFMHLPEGRKATFDYIRTLWDFPQPWVPRLGNPDVRTRDQTTVNPQLPQFPPGTQVALVRQMMLFDNQGNLEGTPITESVQVRVYRRVATNGNLASGLVGANEASGQDFYEIKLSRPQLFARKAGGLRAIERTEKEFAIFNSFGPDEGPPNQRVSLDKHRPVLEECVQCHRDPGINSVNTRGRLLKPNWLEQEFPAGVPEGSPWEYGQDIGWKQDRYDWGLLNGYWNSTNNK